MFSRVDQLGEVARSEGLTLVELAYAWLASRPGVDAILVGPATVEHLDARARGRRAQALGGGACEARRARARLDRDRHALCPLGAHREARASRSALAPDADSIDVAGAIAHFREHGWARLGTVASAAALERLRARASDIMLGPGHPRWALLPARLGDGALRGARLRPRLGGAEPRVPEDREARGRSVLPRVARERGLRARRDAASSETPSPSTGRRSSRRARAAERCCRGTRTAGASGGSTGTRSCRSGRRSTTRRRSPAASRCSTRATTDGLATPLGGTIPRDRLQRAARRRARRRAAGARGRGAPHPQLPLAPVGPEHDGAGAPRLHRLVHQRGHSLHPAPARPAIVHPCIRPLRPGLERSDEPLARSLRHEVGGSAASGRGARARVEADADGARPRHARHRRDHRDGHLRPHGARRRRQRRAGGRPVVHRGRGRVGLRRASATRRWRR